MMSETALIFFIISFGLIIIVDILFIIYCIVVNSRLSREEEDERVEEIFRKRNSK